MCSADNFGLGAIAAELTSPHVTDEGVAGIINYEAEFFATNEREIAFRKWMTAERPDVTLVRERFAKVDDAGEAYRRILTENDDLDCVFVVWDVPAPKVLSAIRGAPRRCPWSQWIWATRSPPNSVRAECLRGSRRNGPMIRARPRRAQPYSD